MLLTLLLSLVGIYLLANVLYYTCFSIASLLAPTESQNPLFHFPKNRFAILIPAYKEDAVIRDSALNVLKQNYPSDYLDVIVIADSLEPETIKELRKLPITVLEVHFEKSTKAKSLHTAVKSLPKAYDIALILDADNHLAPDFLNRVNICYNEGHQVIQAHRTAKNLNTPFARLDAISEEINNAIFRKGHQRLGFSSALIGSGMAMDYELHRHYIASIQTLGGFDKELEIKLLRDGVKIKYLESAKVYDEKVASPEVFEKQRTRWMAAQIKYARLYFIPAFLQLFTKGNLDYFNKALQFVLLPRLMLLGILTIGTFVLFFIEGYWAELSLALWVLNALALLLAIPGEFYEKEFAQALLDLPQAFGRMILSTFKMQKAKNNFLHTPHTTTHKK